MPHELNEQELRKKIKNGTANAETYYLMGLITQGRPYFQKAIQLNPFHTGALIELARSIMVNNPNTLDPLQVATYLTTAIRTNPDLWQARLLRAGLYSSLGGSMEALEDLAAVVGFHRLNNTQDELNLFLEQEHVPLLNKTWLETIRELEESYLQKKDEEVLKLLQATKEKFDQEDPALVVEDLQERKHETYISKQEADFYEQELLEQWDPRQERWRFIEKIINIIVWMLLILACLAVAWLFLYEINFIYKETKNWFVVFFLILLAFIIYDYRYEKKK